MSVTKHVQLLLSLEDEIRWSGLLKSAVPGIKFLDGNVWAEGPEDRGGIEACSTGIAYLFNGDLKLLPRRSRVTGDVEGPISGCVVQAIRCRLVEGVVLSGRVAVGFEKGNGAMEEFVGKVWGTLKEIGRRGVYCEDGSRNSSYLVGHDLRDKVRSGVVGIGDRATRTRFYLSDAGEAD